MSQYYQPLEAEIVLYTLWKRREEIHPTKLRVKRITDSALSEKRAATTARYAVRVIASEALDAIGLTDEAQKLRDLHVNVDLRRAHEHANASASVAYATTDAAADAYHAAAFDAYNAAAFAADAANYAADLNVDYHDVTIRDAHETILHAAEAAYLTKRYVYHLDKMIELCLKIK